MELSRQYYDVMDPFVTPDGSGGGDEAAQARHRICLVIQRDTIQTAKSVASLDQVSGGRFIFGIGGGWNAEEMEDHGTLYATRFQKMREQIEAMKAIWTEDIAEYHGEIVDFPPMIARPKPVQKPHPPVIVGGAFPPRRAARDPLRRRLLPQGPAAGSGSPEDYMPRLRRMAEEAGRDPGSPAGHHRRRPGRSGTHSALRGSRRCPRHGAPARSQGGRDPAGPRPLGGADPPGQPVISRDSRRR